MSGRKNALLPYNAIVNGDMSGNITSPVTSIQFLDNCCIQLIFTGAPIGTFEVQVSTDYAVNSSNFVTNAGNWVPLPLAPAPVAVGVADDIIIDMNQIPAPWMRVVYTATSGTGNLNMFITSKML